MEKLIAIVRDAAARSGRSRMSILLEMVRLKTGLGRLTSGEYADFRLYLDDLSWHRKKQFCGLRAWLVLEDILVDDFSRLLSVDKLTMYIYLKGIGLPIPELLAVYDRATGTHLVQTLHSPEDLSAFLRRCLPERPLYFKPSAGSAGVGNKLVQSIVGNDVVLGCGKTLALDQFCASLGEQRGMGWVIQEALVAHPDIAARLGNKISGIRIHTFLGKHGPEVTKAIWKINAGKLDSDNFERGKTGNMLAAVDLASGRVERIVGGVGPDQIAATAQSKSGHDVADALVGFELPHWPQILDLVLRAANAFPGFICPGWDIAICPDGPRVIEVNHFGAVDLSQHAYRQGFLDDRLLELIESRGLLAYLQRANPFAPRGRQWNSRRGWRQGHWKWWC